LAIEMGCRVSIDTDAHAPGQLDWLPYGCSRAAECEVPVDRIVNTMSALEGADTASIGHKVGAALVGTFLGILVSYGLVGPIASAMESKANEGSKAFEVVKMALVASVRGYAPSVAVEFARKLLFSEVRPTFADLENELKGRPKSA